MDERLQKFIKVVEAGSFTQAAKELRIAQPSLSYAVKKLEYELGTELFMRIGKKIELTPAGRTAYQAALEHQDITNELFESLRRLALKRPQVTIGMVDSVADVLCASKAFETLEQAADVTLIVNNSRYLREGVECRKIDVALTIHDELEHSGLSTTSFATEQLKLVFAPSLQEMITKNLKEHRIKKFISYDKPSTTYKHIQRAFSDLGIRTSVGLYSTSPSIMLGMVLSGKGCAVLPAAMVDSLIDHGELMTAKTTILRPVCLVTAPNKQLSAELQQFLQESAVVMKESC